MVVETLELGAGEFPMEKLVDLDTVEDLIDLFEDGRRSAIRSRRSTSTSASAIRFRIGVEASDHGHGAAMSTIPSSAGAVNVQSAFSARVRRDGRRVA